MKHDLTGQKFGELLVSRAAFLDKHGNRMWNCVCSCSKKAVVTTAHLRSGHTKSCGCHKAKEASRRRRLNLIGQKFERLIVSKSCGIDSRGNHTWECVCGCGKTTVATATSLIQGKKKSCGCYTRDMTIARNLVHGFAKTPEYTAWCHMRRRCLPAYNRHYDYFDRGIRVCPEWDDLKTGFLTFLEYLTTTIGLRPSSKHSLDRIDNDGSYEPGNVRWATAKEQNANQRPRLRIEQYSDATFLAEARRRGFILTKPTFHLSYLSDLTSSVTPSLQNRYKPGTIAERGMLS